MHRIKYNHEKEANFCVGSQKITRFLRNQKDYYSA
jgi:hypothetical protein